MRKSERYDFDVERRFTQTYQEYQNAPLAFREAKCLEQMYPYIFQDIKTGDLFAGRICMSYIGFSPEPGGLGYYCDAAAIRRELDAHDYTEEFRSEIEELLDFWKDETTAAKTRAAYPPEIANVLPSDDWLHEPLAVAPLYRMAGSYPDYQKLLTLGIPGLRRLVADRKKKADEQGEEVSLFEGMEMVLDLMEDCLHYYQEMAVRLADVAEEPSEAEELRRMAETLRNLTVQKPETLREAMQLMWLYILISGTFNYGRMDILFGDFLDADLKNGTITWQQAQQLFIGLWKLIADRL